MPALSENEIRSRAIKFADEWKDAHYEKGQTQTFYNEFFEIFGGNRKDVGFFERAVKKIKNSKFIDLFWPGVLIVEQKSRGRNLDAALTQVEEYFLLLPSEERPRYFLVSDFQSFIFVDLETREEHQFKLSELPNYIHLFDFISGRTSKVLLNQADVNLKAAKKMTKLHDELEKSGYTGRPLEVFLIRIMFCFFADDTGIFEQDTLHNYLENRTLKDGSDLGLRLNHLFKVLDTPKDKRQKKLDSDLAQFEYINGNLFSEPIGPPDLDSELRDIIIKCSAFDWSKVSPAIFGSIFQSVMLPEKQ